MKIPRNLMEERLRYLEEVNRFTLDALEMASSLGNFQPDLGKLEGVTGILSDSCARIERLINFRVTSFYLVDELDSDFSLSLSKPDEERERVQAEIDYFIENGTFGWALRENRPVVVSSESFDSQIILHSMATSSRIRGMFVGVLPCDAVEIPDVSLSLLSIVLLNSANALESYELYKMVSDINQDLEIKIRDRTSQLEFQALHDPLTLLANRALIFDHLEQELRALKRRKKNMAFLLIDLDRFKEVNDTLGHVAGDKLLVEFAHRLTPLFRDTDTVARLGGDEFAVFLSEILDQENALIVTQRILAAVEEPFVVEDHFIDVDISIGVVIIPAQGEDRDTVLKRADMAMYAAKRAKSGYTVYNTEMGEGNLTRLTLMGELRKGIDNAELLLHFQPKVDLSTGRVCGSEALIRWLNPKRGLVPPGDFIPLAEQGGLIKIITLKVIEMTLFQQRIWLQEGIRIPTAVNLSAMNLQDQDLPARIAEMLHEYGVPAEFLECEITESAIMTMPSRGLKVVRELSEMGLKLFIDDFGTGYSSLAYLKNLPVQVIKIDHSFVAHMDTEEKDSTIVHAIIDLGHNLGMQVVAEGVENATTYKSLASLGCDMAQGYFMSRPLPVEDFHRWLTENDFRFSCR